MNLILKHFFTLAKLFVDVSWDNLDYHVYDAYNTPPFYESEPEEELTMKSECGYTAIHICKLICIVTIENIADLQTRVAKLEEQSETMKSEYFEKECRLLKLISETKAYVIKKTKEKVYQALGMYAQGSKYSVLLVTTHM